MQDLKLSFKCVVPPAIVERFFEGRAKVERGKNADMSWISSNLSEAISALSSSGVTRPAISSIASAISTALAPSETQNVETAQVSTEGGSGVSGILGMLGGFLKELNVSSVSIPETESELSITFEDIPEVPDDGTSSLVTLLSHSGYTKNWDWTIRPVSDAELQAVFGAMRVNGEKVSDASGSDTMNLLRSLFKVSRNPNFPQIVAAFHARLFGPKPAASAQPAQPGAQIAPMFPDMSAMFSFMSQAAPPPAPTVTVDEALDDLE